MAHEDYLMRLNMLEQRIQRVQEQLMIIEQQRAELERNKYNKYENPGN